MGQRYRRMEDEKRWPSFIFKQEFAVVRRLKPVVKKQRWCRGHKARGQGQGHKKIRGQGQGQPFRGQILSRPRTGIFEAKNQERRRQVFSKKRSSTTFLGNSQKKRSSKKFFQRSTKF